jgi:hypothetical protein
VREGEREAEGGSGGERVIIIMRGRGEIKGKGEDIYKYGNLGRV